MDYLPLLRCPNCKAKVLKEEKNSEGEEILKCKDCNTTFPVINGIPRFVPAENYADSFGFQWNIHDKTQLDSYTGFPISHDRVFGVTGWEKSLQGQRILEAGSGAGRFTEVLITTGAEIFSFDFSKAVDANMRNNGEATNLRLLQADIFNIPFSERKFDKVFCLGVIQHTPDPEKAFKSLAKQVRPGGELVIDIYTKSFVSSLQWKYLLRPVTKHMNQKILYRLVTGAVSIFLPLAILFRKVAGRVGARLLPIVEYSHLGFPYSLNKQWAILDTFDMYSPAHDHPQSIKEVNRWFIDLGFEDVNVQYGLNGVIAKGRRSK